jgi:hypothetical protein
MFSFFRTMKALDDLWLSKPPDPALSWDTRVQFDPGLVARLGGEYAALSRRVAALAADVGGDAKIAAAHLQECAACLHDLRRTEALWLYPVIASGIADDAEARRQFLQLRLTMLGRARRILRRIDELAKAALEGAGTSADLAGLGAELEEYRRRNEAEIFPLYTLMARASTQKSA